MDREDIEELVILLNKIEGKTVTIGELKGSLSEEEALKNSLILFYACEYCYDRLGGRLLRLVQSHTNAPEKAKKEELLKLLSEKAFEAALELKLTKAAKLIASKFEPLLSPEILVRFSNEEKYNLKLFLEKETEIISPSNQLVIKDEEAEQQPQNAADNKEKAVAIKLFTEYHDITIPLNPANDENTNINYCLAYGKEEDAMKIFQEKIDMPKEDSLLLALYLDRLEYAVAFTKQKIPLKDKASDIFSLLFHKISKRIDREVGNLEIYFYIIRSYMNHTEIEHAMEFAEAVDSMLDSKESAKCLSKLLNPVKFIVHLIELTIEFRARFSKTKIKLEPIKEKLIQLGVSIFEGVKSKEHAKLLLEDKDFDDRDTLAIILKYSLKEFFNNATGEEIAREVWNGPYNSTMNPLSPTSGIWKIVAQSKFLGEKDVEKKLWNDPFKRDSKKRKAHQFEFSVWKTSASLNVAFLAIEYIGLALAIFAIELLISYAYYGMKENKEVFQGLYNTTKVLNSTELEMKYNNPYYEACEQARDRIFYWFVLAILIFISSFRGITHTLFYYLTGRTSNESRPRININLSLLLILLVMFLLYAFSDKTLSIRHKNVVEDELVRLAQTTNDDRVISIFSAIAEFLIVFRAAILFQYTDSLGPLVIAIKSMLGKVVKFGIIYIVMIIAFSLPASLLFENKDQGFEKPFDVIFTIFQASLTVFEMNSEDEYGLQSKIFLVLLVFVMNVVLLNFVIAILNDTYTNIVTTSSAMLYKLIISLREQYQFHQDYQFMVTSCLLLDVPLSVISLLFCPHLPSKQKASFNKGMLYVEYTFWFIILLALYILVEILLLPIAYLVAVVVKVNLFIKGKDKKESVNNGGNKSEGSFATRLGKLLLFIVFGIFILGFYMLIDIGHFIHHAYTHDLQEETDKKDDLIKNSAKAKDGENNEDEPIKDLNEVIKAIDSHDTNSHNIIERIKSHIFNGSKESTEGKKKNFLEKLRRLSSIRLYIEQVKSFAPNVDIKSNLQKFFKRFERLYKLKKKFEENSGNEYTKYTVMLMEKMRNYEENVYSEGIENYFKGDAMSQCLELLQKMSSKGENANPKANQEDQY